MFIYILGVICVKPEIYFLNLNGVIIHMSDSCCKIYYDMSRIILLYCRCGKNVNSQKKNKFGEQLLGMWANLSQLEAFH